MIERIYFDVYEDEGAVRLVPEEYGILLAQKTVSKPEPSVYRVNVAGRSGSIDMTEWAGYVSYGDRSITLKMRDMNGNADAFSNRLVGRRCRLYFGDDDEWYYVGRCERITPTIKRRVTDLNVQLTCHPFKYPIYEAQDYAPGSYGQPYPGRRTFSMTATDNAAVSVTRTLHQDAASKLTVSLDGYNEVVGTGVTVKISVNGTEYPVTSSGAVDGTICLTHGRNAIELNNVSNGSAVTATFTFRDEVI